MARQTLNTGQAQANKAKSSGKPNPYCGGMWVREKDGKQILTYTVKSDDDKQKLLAHLQASIESGDPFTLKGIENSYKGNNHKAPNYVWLIPTPREEDA